MAVNRIKTVLIDLSGTLHIEDNAIPGAVEALKTNLLRAQNFKPMLLVDEAALEDFPGLTDVKEEEYNAVVVGLAPKMFNYGQLNKAFRLLLNGASLIAIHCGRYYKCSDGLALGPGPFVRGLEYASDCRCQVVGKPSAVFFQNALGDIDPANAVMIGDGAPDMHSRIQKMSLLSQRSYRDGFFKECSLFIT